MTDEDTMSANDLTALKTINSRSVQIKSQAMALRKRILKDKSHTFQEGCVYYILSKPGKCFFINRLGPHPLSQTLAAYGFELDGETVVPAMIDIIELGGKISI